MQSIKHFHLQTWLEDKSIPNLRGKVHNFLFFPSWRFFMVMHYILNKILISQGPVMIRQRELNFQPSILSFEHTKWSFNLDNIFSKGTSSLLQQWYMKKLQAIHEVYNSKKEHLKIMETNPSEGKSQENTWRSFSNQINYKSMTKHDQGSNWKICKRNLFLMFFFWQIYSFKINHSEPIISY